MPKLIRIASLLTFAYCEISVAATGVGSGPHGSYNIGNGDSAYAADTGANLPNSADCAYITTANPTSDNSVNAIIQFFDGDLVMGPRGATLYVNGHTITRSTSNGPTIRYSSTYNDSKPYAQLALNSALVSHTNQSGNNCTVFVEATNTQPLYLKLVNSSTIQGNIINSSSGAIYIVLNNGYINGDITSTGSGYTQIKAYGTTGNSLQNGTSSVSASSDNIDINVEDNSQLTLFNFRTLSASALFENNIIAKTNSTLIISNGSNIQADVLLQQATLYVNDLGTQLKNQDDSSNQTTIRTNTGASSINIAQGATIHGSNTGNTAIRVDNHQVTIDTYGTINATGGNAVLGAGTGVTNLNLRSFSTTNGNVTLNNAANAVRINGSTIALNGTINGGSTAAATVAIGNTSATNFTATNPFSTFNILKVISGSTLTVTNTFSSIASTINGGTLALNNGTFNNTNTNIYNANILTLTNASVIDRNVQYVKNNTITVSNTSYITGTVRFNGAFADGSGIGTALNSDATSTLTLTLNNSAHIDSNVNHGAATGVANVTLNNTSYITGTVNLNADSSVITLNNLNNNTANHNYINGGVTKGNNGSINLTNNGIAGGTGNVYMNSTVTTGNNNTITLNNTNIASGSTYITNIVTQGNNSTLNMTTSGTGTGHTYLGSGTTVGANAAITMTNTASTLKNVYITTNISTGDTSTVTLNNTNTAAGNIFVTGSITQTNGGTLAMTTSGTGTGHTYVGGSANIGANAAINMTNTASTLKNVYIATNIATGDTSTVTLNNTNTAAGNIFVTGSITQTNGGTLAMTTSGTGTGHTYVSGSANVGNNAFVNITNTASTLKNVYINTNLTTGSNTDITLNNTNTSNGNVYVTGTITQTTDGLLLMTAGSTGTGHTYVTGSVNIGADAAVMMTNTASTLKNVYITTNVSTGNNTDVTLNNTNTGTGNVYITGTLTQTDNSALIVTNGSNAGSGSAYVVGLTSINDNNTVTISNTLSSTGHAYISNFSARDTNVITISNTNTSSGNSHITGNVTLRNSNTLLMTHTGAGTGTSYISGTNITANNLLTLTMSNNTYILTTNNIDIEDNATITLNNTAHITANNSIDIRNDNTIRLNTDAYINTPTFNLGTDTDVILINNSHLGTYTLAPAVDLPVNLTIKEAPLNIPADPLDPLDPAFAYRNVVLRNNSYIYGNIVFNNNVGYPNENYSRMSINENSYIRGTINGMSKNIIHFGDLGAIHFTTMGTITNIEQFEVHPNSRLTIDHASTNISSTLLYDNAILDINTAYDGSINGVTGSNNTVINIGEDTTVNHTTGGIINNINTINVATNSTFTIAHPISFLKTALNIEAGSKVIVNQIISGNADINNEGHILLKDDVYTIGTFINGENSILELDGHILTYASNLIAKGTLKLKIHSIEEYDSIEVTGGPGIVDFSEVHTLDLDTIPNPTNNKSFIFVIAKGREGTIAKAPDPSVYTNNLETLFNKRFLRAAENRIEIANMRVGYDEVATTPHNKITGRALEDIAQLGYKTPEQEQLIQLLESAKTVAEHDYNMNQLYSINTTAVPMVVMPNNSFQQLGSRLANLQQYQSYLAGASNDYIMWLKPFYSKVRQKRSVDIASFKSKAYGMILGFDRNDISRSFGFAFTASNTNMDSYAGYDATAKTFTIEALNYGQIFTSKNIFIDWMGMLSLNTAKQRRNMLIANTSFVAASKCLWLHSALKAGIGYDHFVDDHILLNYLVHAKFDFVYGLPYSESGNHAASLKVTPRPIYSLELGAGPKLYYKYSLFDLKLTNMFKANMSYRPINPNFSTKCRYVTGSNEFNIRMREPRISYTVGTEMTVNLSKSLQLSAEYSLDTNTLYKNHNLNLSAKYIF